MTNDYVGAYRCRCRCYHNIRSLRLLSATTAGFEGSSTVYRAPSEAEGFEADPSFTIAATDPSYLTVGSLLPDDFLRFPY